MTISQRIFTQYFCTGEKQKDAILLMVAATMSSDTLEDEDYAQWLSFCNKHIPPGLISSSSNATPESDKEDKMPLLPAPQGEQNLSTFEIMQSLGRHYDKLPARRKDYFCEVVRNATIGLFNSLGYYTKTRFPILQDETMEAWIERASKPKECIIYQAITNAFPGPFYDAYHNIKEHIVSEDFKRDSSTWKGKDSIAEETKVDFTEPPSEKLKKMFETSSFVNSSRCTPQKGSNRCVCM